MKGTITYSVIILAYTVDASSYHITKTCIDSLWSSFEDKNALELIVIESGAIALATYHIPHIQIIAYDTASFNFHHALNLGLEQAQGDYIAFCNNDLIFHNHWLETIIKEMKNNSLDVASPVDPEKDKLWMIDKKNTSFIKGYEIQKHFKGWCFVVDKNVFKVLQQFDERFDFYFADTDFITQVEIAGFKHAVVLDAHVHHLEKKSQETVQDVQQLLQENQVDIATIPNYVIKENRWWLVTNKKMIDGLIKYHHKWGKPKAIQIKKVVSSYLNNFKFKSLSRFLFLR
jgi:glycosyltransferase involved in cell wall biosynthesis